MKWPNKGKLRRAELHHTGCPCHCFPPAGRQAHTEVMVCYSMGVLHLWLSLEAGYNYLPLCSELFFQQGSRYYQVKCGRLDLTVSNILSGLGQRSEDRDWFAWRRCRDRGEVYGCNRACALILSLLGKCVHSCAWNMCQSLFSSSA